MENFTKCTVINLRSLKKDDKPVILIALIILVLKLLQLLF